MINMLCNYLPQAKLEINCGLSSCHCTSFGVTCSFNAAMFITPVSSFLTSLLTGLPKYPTSESCKPQACNEP